MQLINLIFKLLKFKTFLVFLKGFHPKIKQEVLETKQMFICLCKGDFTGAKEQGLDIIKMVLIFGVFMIPFAGGAITGFILKKFKGIRPTSFK